MQNPHLVAAERDFPHLDVQLGSRSSSPDGDGRAGGALGALLIVRHLKGCRVGGGRGVSVRDCSVGGGGTVAEVPDIGGDRSAGIGGTGSVEAEGQGGCAARRGGGCHGGWSPVGRCDGSGDHNGGAGGVGQSPAVGKGQGGGVGPGRGEAVRGVCAGGRGAIAEAPGRQWWQEVESDLQTLLPGIA